MPEQARRHEARPYNGSSSRVYEGSITVTHDQGVESALEASDRRLAAQSDALTALTEQQASGAYAFEERLRRLVETTARTLRAERVGLWQFEDGASAIRCLDMYELSADRHDAGARLHRTDYPRYFAALQHERFIAADDAQQDPRTAEFIASYLTPHHIRAMLDVPLRQDDRARGVLCVEHVGAPPHRAPSSRDWPPTARRDRRMERAILRDLRLVARGAAGREAGGNDRAAVVP